MFFGKYMNVASNWEVLNVTVILGNEVEYSVSQCSLSCSASIGFNQFSLIIFAQRVRTRRVGKMEGGEMGKNLVDKEKHLHLSFNEWGSPDVVNLLFSWESFYVERLMF